MRRKKQELGGYKHSLALFIYILIVNRLASLFNQKKLVEIDKDLYAHMFIDYDWYNIIRQ